MRNNNMEDRLIRSLDKRHAGGSSNRLRTQAFDSHLKGDWFTKRPAVYYQKPKTRLYVPSLSHTPRTEGWFMREIAKAIATRALS